MRNLGFEDTPDYDFLRDLFTQALKNTGEVEDGEYDWMKLNGGRGWEAVKAHPSQHLHNPNAPPEASARALHGQAVRPDSKTPLNASRLNAAQPPTPGAPAKPGAVAAGNPGPKNGQSRDPRKRVSAQGEGTPTASTQAQFPNSATNLANSQSKPSPATGALQNQARPAPQQEQQPGFMSKLMKTLCCG